MKRFLLIALLSVVFLPAQSADFGFTDYRSQGYLSRPDSSRFEYSLPDNMKFLKRKSKTVEQNDVDEITLDEEDIKPVKKVIKKLGSDYQPQDDFNQKDANTPMNYDNFPKFYNPNDLMNQQFIPMTTF